MQPNLKSIWFLRGKMNEQYPEETKAAWFEISSLTLVMY